MGIGFFDKVRMATEMSRSRDYVDGVPAEVSERILRRRRLKKKTIWQMTDDEFAEFMANCKTVEEAWERAG